MEIKEVVPSFRDKVIQTFETMLNMKPSVGEVEFDGGGNIVSDVTGTIGITGDLSGTVSIRFPQSLACKVSSMFLGEDIKEVNHDVLDTVGELANIIAGSAKGVLNQDKNIDFKISIPTAVQGEHHILGHPAGSSVIYVPFELEGEKFYLELCLKNEK